MKDNKCTNSISDLNSKFNDLEYNFLDLFDIDEIQQLQDSFALATGVASIITDVDGTPITNPSNFCAFCNEIVRKSEKGSKNCALSDAIIGSPKKDGPRIQRCLSGGLIDGGASIMIGEKHIANWLVGQILDSESDVNDILCYAKQLGVENEVALDALSKVTRMTKQQFIDICNFLFLMAQQLSNLAVKNVEQIHEITMRKIIEQEITSLNNALEQKVLDRTIQLEESNSELGEINAILEEEIAERLKVEEHIKSLNNTLDDKIIERTAQLQDMNAILEEEISEKNKAENELNKERFFTDAVLNSVPGLLYLYDEKGQLIRWNKQHEEMTGYSSQELSHLNIMDWYKNDNESATAVIEGIQTTLREGNGAVEANLRRKDGSTIPMYLTAVRLEIEGKIYFTGIGIDLTERRKWENERSYINYHDALTGLYNRRYFEEELKRFDIESKLPLSIIIGDVNGLKLVNDAFGHQKGDELLKQAAETIQSNCRKEDVIVRWGGDEFIILMPNTNKEDAERTVESIKKQYTYDQSNSLSISVSFGWDTKQKADEEIQTVLKNAEDCMIKHKIIENAGMRSNTIKTIIKTLHEKNPREEAHSKRVSEICLSIGIALGLSEIVVSQLKVVGLLHDIGKIAIEEGILNKPGRLTIMEWNEIKRHPEIGYRILCASQDMLEIAEYILAHHERWDGTGYPNGLKGEAIPMASRIIAIADTYDAMTSKRAYRNAMSEKEALDEIQRNVGTQFDPEIVRIFIEKVLVAPQEDALLCNKSEVSI
ncbi:MAG: PocR ligand-binding domain-containing protein [Vallitaleaceae bacterium]|nr:PocR ligand-binding domain-containing protein [Vallitaleaceae bacterium]